MSKMKKALDVVQDLRNLADSLEALANAAGATDAASAPDVPERTEQQAALCDTAEQPSDQPKLTIVELRAFVAERSTPENRQKIRDILARYGVGKLTELSEAHYADVMSAVTAL